MRRPILLLALACQLFFSGQYLIATPAFEGPDESDHYAYGFHLSHARSLPIFRRTAADLGRSPLDEATLAHHPPLYYLLLAATMRAVGQGDTATSLRKNPHFAAFAEGEPSAHLFWLHGADERAPVSAGIRLLRLLRSLSVLCGLISVWLTHRLARLAFPEAPGVADMAALLMACLPMWSFMHGVLDNGNLAVVGSHASVLVLAGGLAAGRLDLRCGLVFGLLAGLTLATKLVGIFLLPLAAGAWAWALVRAPERRGETLVSGVAALLVIAALTGWFFLRNVTLYGEPLALTAHAEVFASVRVPEEYMWGWLLHNFLPDVFSSLLGHLGWWILPPPPWLVGLGVVLALAAAVGWGAVLRRRPSGLRVRVIVLLAAAALLVFLSVARFNMTMRQPQGRYLFPALGPFLVLLCFGVRSLVPTGWRAPLTAPAVVLPILVASLVLWGHYRPVFDPALSEAPATYAGLVRGVTVVPAEPRLELHAPADGARLDSAPTFRWSVPGDVAPDAAWTLHVWTAEGRILLTTFEQTHQPLEAGAWTLPDTWWALFPDEVDLFWRIRGVPDRAAGETEWDVPSSPAFRLQRASRG